MPGRSTLPVFVCSAAMLTLCSAPVLAETKLTDWSVVTTFRSSEPAVICATRFPAPRDNPTLSLEARAPKGSSTLAADFIVGNLPPLLAGTKGILRDIGITIGNAWSATGLKADWSKGSGDANSKMTIHAAPAVGGVIQPIANGGTLTITVPLVNGGHTYSFDLTGALSPMTAFVDCLRRWGPQ